MKNIISVIPALAFLFAAILACSSPNQTNVAKSEPAKRVASRSNLFTKKHPDGTTGVYQQHLKLSSPAAIRGKRIPGDHKFELSNIASYKGDQPKCESSSLAISIFHDKPAKSAWQFPKSAKVLFLADGKSSEPVKTNQLPLELEDGEYWEPLSFSQRAKRSRT